MTNDAPEIEVLLAFADDEHLMGQQHTEWIGVAPFLEEDLAFASIGQDELSHAVMLYEQVLERRGIEPTDVAIDALAYRSGEDYRSCALAEYTTTDWAQTLVRHWIYDTVEHHRWVALADVSPALGALASTAERDEAFHRRHADALLDTLLVVPEARAQVLAGLDAVLPLASSLADAVDRASFDLSDAIAQRFGVDPPPIDAPSLDHRSTRSAHFDPLMTRMREVLDLDLEATW